MKLLHILDESSFKNISIVRVAEIFSRYKFKNYQSEIISRKKKIELKNSKIKHLLFSNYFYFLKLFILLKKKQTNIVHVHGLWSFFNLLIVIYCKCLGISFIIQPHGMLLDQALKSKSYIKYSIKILVIKFLYKFIFSKNVYFIAVTNEEKISIKKYFPLTKVEIIQNPFQIIDVHSKKINKKFVYFGRYNEHKNLEKMILAFKSANLGQEWSLDIYGINDDDNYKKNLKKLAKENNYKENICFKKPIFDPLKKFKILSESWCNILISKSEVLSLSVLEALSVGTKNLINKNIFYPSWIRKISTSSSLEQKNLVLKFKQLTNVSKKNKILEKVKIVNSFKKNYNFLDFKKKYLNILNTIYNLKNNLLQKNILLYFIINFLNSSHIAAIIIITVLAKEYNLASEIGLVPGIYFLILQLLSGNARSILLYELLPNSFIFRTIYFRIFFGFWLLFFLGIFLYFIDNIEYKLLLYLLSIVVYFSWISELIISFYEKNYVKFLSFFYILFYFLFYFIFISKIFVNSLSINYILFVLLVIKFIFLFINIEIFNKNIFSPKINIQFLVKKIMPFKSSFFNIMAVIAWRISIFFIASKDYAGILYASFAIASFPGTFFNNFIGQTILINENIKVFIFKYYKIIYFLSLSIIISLIRYLGNYNLKNENLYDFLYFTLISIVGTHIMLLALFERHQQLYLKKVNKNLIFKKDILYGIIIAPLIIILNYLFDASAIGFAYLISSFIALFVYKLR